MNNNKGSPGKPLFSLMGFLILATFSYFGYAIVSSQITQARISKIFKPTEAIVLSSNVDTFNAGNPKSSDSYALAIEYQYEVNGRRYRAHRYAYMSVGFKNYDNAKNVLDQYPAGKRITVYYDPEKPADAVIYRKPIGLPVVMMAFPFVLFGLIGLLMLIHGFRRIPAAKK